MLLNTTYKNKEIEEKICQAVGKPYSLLYRIKQKGIGSPKMKIISASSEIYSLLQLDQNLNSCNVELRPKGIIIAFQKRLETYALVIPFYKLNIYKGDIDSYTFFKDHYKIKIRATNKDLKIHNFIKKIKAEKDNQKPINLEYL